MRKGKKALNAYLFLSLKQNAQGSIKDFQCHRSIPINWLKILSNINYENKIVFYEKISASIFTIL